MDDDKRQATHHLGLLSGSSSICEHNPILRQQHFQYVHEPMYTHKDVEGD